jgi:hypothetical protein
MRLSTKYTEYFAYWRQKERDREHRKTDRRRRTIGLYRQHELLTCDLSHSLCGLVVRVSGYISRGPGFNSRRFQVFLEPVGLERGPLSLARTTELLEGKVAAPV